MDAHRARAGSKSTRRIANALVLSVIAAFAAGVAGPATAVAGVNSDHVQLELINFLTGAKEVNFYTVRFTETPVDSATAVATEAADGSVSITSRSAAAGGFTATAPCFKTEAQTAVCPARDERGFPVTAVGMRAAVGNNDFTADVPTHDVFMSFGNEGNTASVPHSRTSHISGGNGNDTLRGGTGVDRITSNGGLDTIFVFDEPAQRDTVVCGTPEVERPVDVVHADTLDIFENRNCGRIIIGP